jgi:hypothetical protein
MRHPADRRLPILVATLAALLLAGCSALPVTVADGQLVARDRWHTGTVARTVADDALPARLRPACGNGAEANTAQRWALIDHRPDRSLRRTAVPLDAGQAPADGAVVLVLAQGCRRAWAPRTLAASAAADAAP